MLAAIAAALAPARVLGTGGAASTTGITEALDAINTSVEIGSAPLFVPRRGLRAAITPGCQRWNDGCNSWTVDPTTNELVSQIAPFKRCSTDQMGKAMCECFPVGSQSQPWCAPEAIIEPPPIPGLAFRPITRPGR